VEGRNTRRPNLRPQPKVFVLAPEHFLGLVLLLRLKQRYLEPVVLPEARTIPLAVSSSVRELDMAFVAQQTLERSQVLSSARKVQLAMLEQAD
jgi:hypothetical protein